MKIFLIISIFTISLFGVNYKKLIQAEKDPLVKQALICEQIVMENKENIENKNECKKAISMYEDLKSKKELTKRSLRIISPGHLYFTAGIVDQYLAVTHKIDDKALQLFEKSYKLGYGDKNNALLMHLGKQYSTHYRKADAFKIFMEGLSKSRESQVLIRDLIQIELDFLCKENPWACK